MIKNLLRRSYFFSRTEEIMQVNSLNQRIGKVSRNGITKEVFFRTCNIFLMNSEGKLVVQQRAEHIKPFPLYWDAAPGGVVRINETDAEAAKREIFEEMGVEVDDLEKLATVSIENEGWFWWSSFFKAKFKGNIEKSKDIHDYRLMSLKDVRRSIDDGDKFTPSCIVGLKWLK